MASGRTHFQSNALMGVTMISLAVVIWWGTLAWVWVLLGSLIGLFCTPDMDLEGRTYTERLLWRIGFRVGKRGRFSPVGFSYQWGWYGYALLFPHRQLSHNKYLLGTLTRVGWSFVLFTLGCVGVAGAAFFVGWDPEPVRQFFVDFVQRERNLLLYAAWVLQDINHYVLDAFIKEED